VDCLQIDRDQLIRELRCWQGLRVGMNLFKVIVHSIKKPS
jgi:hypothetical protein